MQHTVTITDPQVKKDPSSTRSVQNSSGELSGKSSAESMPNNGLILSLSGIARDEAEAIEAAEESDFSKFIPYDYNLFKGTLSIFDNYRLNRPLISRSLLASLNLYKPGQSLVARSNATRNTQADRS